MLEKFKETLLDRCKILLDEPIVVGVSGGADSLTLLHLFCRLRIPVWVVYFDHQLRPESKQELIVVRQMAEAWGAKGFISGQEDVHRLAKAAHCSIEAAARQARYRFLFKTAEEKQAKAVAVGHTADDQVETVLLHLIRGSGVDGLRGMDFRTTLQEYSTSIPLIRPLLNIWRREIEQYCRQHDIQPLEDASNQSLEFTRNRIRHELIPVLQEYNPQIKARIWTMSRVVNDHLRVVKPIVENTLNEVCVERRRRQWLSFSAGKLKQLPEEMLSLALREAIAEIKPACENIDWQSLNLAVNEIRSDRRTGTVQIGDGVELVFAQEWIYLKDETAAITTMELPSIPPDREYVLAGAGEVKVGDEWLLQAELLLPNALPPTWKDNPFEAWLDADKVQFPLVMRTWKPGDRFRPLGMNKGSVKIADFLSERKVPRPQRLNYPVVFCGDEVVWLPGLQIADEFRLLQNTRRILHLKLSRV